MDGTLEAIAAQVRACQLCGLCAMRTHAVPGQGSAMARLMLVGEAPGRREDESGLPFVGAAGKNLDLALAAAGIPREEAFVTSIVKCRPPGNRDPTEAEKDACRPFLLGQVAALRPRVIVALGRHGLHGLLGQMPPSFAALPGSFLPGPQGIPVWVSLHPAAIIYRPRWKARYLAQWQAFGRWFRSGHPPPPALEVTEAQVDAFMPSLSPLAMEPRKAAARAPSPHGAPSRPAGKSRKSAKPRNRQGAGASRARGAPPSS